MLATLLFSLVAGAMEFENEGVILKSGQALVVDLKVNKGTLISFEDLGGQILFKDNLTMNGNYTKTFHLEMVPQGTYLLKVEKRFATKSWKIRKSKEGIEILGNSSTISFKPQFRLKEKHVNVFMTNPSRENIGLVVKDENGRVLATLKDSKKVFSKTLDFSKMGAGEYHVSIIKRNEVYNEKVVIQ